MRESAWAIQESFTLCPGDGGLAIGAVVLTAVVVAVATAAARRRILALRADGTIGDAAFQRVEQEPDREELNFEPLGPDEAAGRGPT